MYNAICKAIKGEAKNFQLIYPMQPWNWGKKSQGQTDSGEWSFLNSMPAYSQVGAYQSGSNFKDAYENWLLTLVVEADAELQNRMTIQNDLAQDARNDYNEKVQAAKDAYAEDSSVVDQEPNFRDWLNDEYGEGPSYKSAIDSAREIMAKQDEILDDLVDQADDKVIKEARKKFKDNKYYTKVVSDTIKNPMEEPGYNKIDNYSKWLTQQKNTSPTTFTWNNSQENKSSNNKWAQGGARYSSGFFFSVNVSGKWQEIKEMNTASSIEFTMTFNPMASIPVAPLGWYSEGAIRAKVNNPAAYREGYTPNKLKGSGEGGYILGDGGIMPCRITDILVCYQPAISIKLDESSLNSVYKHMETSGGVRIGPFHFGGGKASSTSYSLKQKSSSSTIEIKSTSQFPYIFGVYVEDFSTK
jgi:hypothetical protein